jgi:putative effector of murein hydrolase
MIKYCRKHESTIKQQLETSTDFQALLEYQNRKIEWLQHERLVHLLVTMLTAILFLFVFGLSLFIKDNLSILVLLGIVTVLLAAYLFHYFRLENTVQRWYLISDEIYHKLNEK